MTPSQPIRPISMLWGLLALLGATPMAWSSAPGGDAAEAATVAFGGIVSAPRTPYLFQGSVKQFEPPRAWTPGDPIRDVPQRRYPTGTGHSPFNPPDPLWSVQQRQSRRSGISDGFTTPTRSFDGLPFTGLAVPDAVGDVGPNHYIQATNAFDGSGFGSSVRIYDKATPLPATLATFNMRALGSGNCLSVFGDPLVIYDRPADRWLLAEVSGAAGTYCVYVSRTGDPVNGGWFAYEFQSPGGVLADYPKLSIWNTDANLGAGSYVVTTNEAAPKVHALDRAAMLAGLPATSQTFTIPALPAFGHQDLLAPQPVGPTPPPPGSPIPVLRHRDTEVHGGSAEGDLIDIWELTIDWLQPANSVLAAVASVDTAEFDSTPCDPLSVACFEQPAPSPPLQPLHEPMMYRLNYWNRGGEESIVGNFTVDADGNDRGGVRWFDLRRQAGAAWSIYQEGTYAGIDGNRWMASIGADARGNLALGFHLSSAAIFPSLRYTGRRTLDPPGVMTIDEVTLGSGSGTINSNRFGDYSLMALDPSDDCTFWFTGQYNNPGSWNTRIASFAFDSCTCAPRPTAPTLGAVAAGDNAVEIQWSDGVDADTSSYAIRRSTRAGGPYTTVAMIADQSPGVGGGAGYSWTDTTVSGGLTYRYVVVALRDDCPSDPSAETEVAATGDCRLAPSFAGLASATSSASATCQVELQWPAAQPGCGGFVRYNLYRSPTAGFTPSPATLVASGIEGTAATDVIDLTSGGTWFYVVRAVDAFSGLEDGNGQQRSVTVGGPGDGTVVRFAEDFTDANALDGWTVSIGPGPHNCPDRWTRTDDPLSDPVAGTGFYTRAASQGCAASTALDSPTVNLNLPGLTGAILQLDVLYRTTNGDDATIEVWNGSGWEVVWSDPNAFFDGRLQLDVSTQALGNPAFQWRFNYQNASNDRWLAVDNVELRSQAQIACAAAATPPAVRGLQVDRDDPATAELRLEFDASGCPASQHNLLHGSLDNVAALALEDAVCIIAPGFEWSPPADDRFFLIVASDGDVEGSWGGGAFGERRALEPSGRCGTTLKNPSTPCP